MSDKTPRDDGLNQYEYDFGFPGDGQEDLTEEERNFSFDEDYLAGDFVPAPEAYAPYRPEEPAVEEGRCRDCRRSSCGNNRSADP